MFLLVLGVLTSVRKLCQLVGQTFQLVSQTLLVSQSDLISQSVRQIFSNFYNAVLYI